MSEKTDQLASGLDAIREGFDMFTPEEVQQRVATLVDVVREMSVDELEGYAVVALRDASNDVQERLRAVEIKRNAVTTLARTARDRLDALQRADAQKEGG